MSPAKNGTQQKMIEPKKAGPIPESARYKTAQLLDQFRNLGLMSGFFGDKEVTFVISKNLDPVTKEIILRPVFVVLTDDLLDLCFDCDHTPLKGGEDEDSQET